MNPGLKAIQYTGSDISHPLSLSLSTEGPHRLYEIDSMVITIDNACVAVAGRGRRHRDVRGTVRGTPVLQATGRGVEAESSCWW